MDRTLEFNSDDYRELADALLSGDSYNAIAFRSRVLFGRYIKRRDIVRALRNPIFYAPLEKVIGTEKYEEVMAIVEARRKLSDENVRHKSLRDTAPTSGTLYYHA
jgi:hypothetical protein